MERLILCGGGHVSLELAHIAERLDFELHIIDDRPEFANTERFPSANVYALDFDSALETLGGRDTDFYCVLTRGHAYDTQCVSSILRRPFAYVGMIGSKAKVAHCRAALLDMGFAPELVEQLHAPIGLDLGGQTPAEIAVSIAAQLIQERARMGRRAITPPEGHGMLVTIVDKQGSAPRGVGACMLVTPEGACRNTIGGGTLEFRAKNMALALMAQKITSARHTFDLFSDDEALGMVCGGIVTVEFKKQ